MNNEIMLLFPEAFFVTANSSLLIPVWVDCGLGVTRQHQTVDWKTLQTSARCNSLARVGSLFKNTMYTHTVHTVSMVAYIQCICSLLYHRKLACVLYLC